MLELIVIVSLALYGTKVTWQDGMIFERPKKWLDGIFQKREDGFLYYISKPLYACPACMASIWGSLIYWAFCCEFTWNYHNAVMWPIFVLSVCAGAWLLMFQFPFDD